MRKPIPLLGALLLLISTAVVLANYKTITVTGYYAIATDGPAVGLAAGGAYTQVSFPIRTYAPYAEYPAGSWARNPDLYNHSEIGFRCVLSGSDAQKLLHLPEK